MSKCDYCGALLQPTDSFCPQCGAPVKEADISESVKEFERLLIEAGGTDKIEYQRRNSFEEASVAGKICWIFLWILFWPIFVFIYIFMKYSFGPKNLTPSESKRANIISNYTFSNDRKTLLEALIFIETQIDILAELRRDAYSKYWINLWTSKAEQVASKAKLSVGEDVTINEIFTRIKSRSKKLVSETGVAFVAKLVVAASVTAFLVYSVIQPFVYRYNIVYDTGAIPQKVKAVEDKNVISAGNVSTAGFLGTCFKAANKEAVLEFKDDHKYLEVTMTVICTNSMSDEIDKKLADKIADFDNKDILSGVFRLNGTVSNYMGDYGLGEIKAKENFTELLRAKPGDEVQIHLLNEVKSYDRAEDYEKVMNVSNLILTMELTYTNELGDDNYEFETLR